MRRLTLPLICLSVVLLTCTAYARKWTDTTGRYSVEAEFIEVKDGKAVLKKTDGETIRVPLGKLCDADRSFIRATLTGKPEQRGKTTASSTTGTRAKSDLQVAGYFVTTRISFGSSTVSPKSVNNAFLVIVVDVPNKHLIPDKRRFVSLAKKLDTDKPREHICEFDPEEYRVYLGKSRVGKKGIYIGEWDDAGKAEFGSWSATISQDPLDPKGSEMIAIGWMLPRSVCRPPLKIKLRNFEPDAVPDKDPRVAAD